MTSLHVDRLSVSANGHGLVAPFSFSLQAGQCLTLLGETGAGKSLLAQAIMGTLPAGLTAQGQVTLDGEDMARLTLPQRRAIWGRRLVLLPQEPWHALDPLMTAERQIRETYRHAAGHSPERAGQDTLHDLASLGLATAGTCLPGELSGGMAQRVAFAAARAAGGKMVIADEPTKGLDSARRDDVVAMLKQTLAEGGALLTITHDVEVARQLGGLIMILRDGDCVEAGPADQVLQQPISEYGRRLVAAEPSRWAPQCQHPRADAPPVIEATQLSKARGGRTLFNELTLSIAPGEIVGISGPSGCGKSTLGDVLLGLSRPDRGEVRRASGIAAPRFQKLYQDPPAAFAPHWTLETLLKDLVRRHRLDPTRIPPLMSRLGLARKLLDRYPSGVSGGELQRFALLRALLLDPVLLFADEPTLRLDPMTQQETMMLLVELARERECAVMLVSHDESLIRHSCDRCLFLGNAELHRPVPSSASSLPA
ncbi:peptide/nickel transport system ATP-binding protein [Modicisalibacter xianhensis]|uniref:Peptide/nickel transport system ATP-binding protein n=1 Tax=Modicisalibacter xianhensis TaxID=442341 RepID=A0A4R8G2N8_9GAMM|nr:ATP-binding cassette domain-containing protein [Halomonas xianhensis]TDX29346.1 peptide/nickel transport system ATP-binding protein [Halomonas xianhensis]